jgi:arabinofuranosyltransferase
MPVTSALLALDRRMPYRILGWLLLAGIVGLITRVAWLSDDAFITLRTIDNFVNGFGLRWNVDERVQAYTHPLWLGALVLPYFATREAWLTTIIVSLTISAIAIALAARTAPDARTRCLLVVALASSSAFRDYSTSGLENPLAHLILAALALVATGAPHRAGLLGGLLAAALLTRLDLALLALPISLCPLLAAPSWHSTRRFMLGLAPLLAWEVFAVCYYGFPFPNTAYAKLATGIPRDELVDQGLRYLRDSFATDSPTLVTIGVAAASGVLVGTWRARAWSAGLLAYLAYVIWIGGDFMSGRFLSAPLLVAVMLLGRERPAGLLLVAPMTLVAGLLAGSASWPGTLPTPAERASVSPHGIVDERRFHAPELGLFTAAGIRTSPDTRAITRAVSGWHTQGLRLREITVAGVPGFLAGPSIHLVDVMALADPLLARLPAKRPWRVGHYERRVPEGYLETLASGTNQIRDVSTRALWEQIRQVTRDPLWSRARWTAIWHLNRSGIRPASVEPTGG